MNQIRIKYLLLLTVVSLMATMAVGQTRMPEELTTATIREQINYVTEKTRIYEDFRAIREDMYRKLTGNILDTLVAEKSKVTELKNLTSAMTGKNDSLNVLIASTRASLEDVTATKNKINVIGLEINKVAYNTILWAIVGGLILVLIGGFLIFKRNLVVLQSTEKDLKELREEFAAYKQSSRIAREKVEMDLFRANQKLKGK